MNSDLTRLPPRALHAVARAIESGDEKYERWDWIFQEERIDSRDDVRAAIGHIFEWLNGIDEDLETGESPLAHAAARLLYILERQARGLEIGTWRAPVEKTVPKEKEKMREKKKQPEMYGECRERFTKE